jgi:hypothetical protein
MTELSLIRKAVVIPANCNPTRVALGWGFDSEDRLIHAVAKWAA